MTGPMTAPMTGGTTGGTTGPATQLVLDLGHRPALGREDFLVAPSNEIAVGWIDRWPDWPGGGLALHGAPGSGKTHLLQVWRAASGAVALDAAALAEAEPPELLGEARACALDGADALTGPAERNLLHLYNLLNQRGGHMLVAAGRPPARWPDALPDLRSRLAALPAVELGAPDETLIAAVLVKLFDDRQLRVEPALVHYLTTRMERSFAAARALVEALDRASLRARRPVTVRLAREVLDGLGDN